MQIRAKQSNIKTLHIQMINMSKILNIDYTLSASKKHMPPWQTS